MASLNNAQIQLIASLLAGAQQDALVKGAKALAETLQKGGYADDAFFDEPRDYAQEELDRCRAAYRDATAAIAVISGREPDADAVIDADFALYVRNAA